VPPGFLGFPDASILRPCAFIDRDWDKGLVGFPTWGFLVRDVPVNGPGNALFQDTLKDAWYNSRGIVIYSIPL